MERVSERTTVAKHAPQDQADQAGVQHQHFVFVRTPYAAGISIHSTLTEAYHHEAVFFLCADPAVAPELIAFLHVVVSSRIALHPTGLQFAWAVLVWASPRAHRLWI